MAVDFGIRFNGFPIRDATDEVPAFIERTLNSLSPHFTTIWIMDHLQFGNWDFFEGWVLAAYLAGAYPRFKYGHLVNSQAFRNPALLAKMGASMQYLTQGRFIMGIGAGWHKEEYDAYHFDLAAPGIRIEQLEDTLHILRAMWTQQPATYHGKHYYVENAYCTPQPNPPPPIMVGSGGNKGIAVAARLADGWNWDYKMETFEPKYRVLEQECAKIGREVRQMWLTCCGDAHFPKDVSEFVPPDPNNAGAEPRLGPTSYARSSKIMASPTSRLALMISARLTCFARKSRPNSPRCSRRGEPADSPCAFYPGTRYPSRYHASTCSREAPRASALA
jgi:hypothetical protein